MTHRGLRVLFSFPHTIGGAGISNVAWHQVNGLAQAGVDVTLYCTSVRRPLHPAVRTHTTFAAGGIRVPRRLLGLERASHIHDAVVARRIRSAAASFDIAHIWPPFCQRAIRAAADRGLVAVREAPTAHIRTYAAAIRAATADTGFELGPGDLGFDPGGVYAARESAEIDLAQWILAPSEYVSHSMVENGVDASRLLRHFYGIDNARFTPPHTQPADDRLTALVVARVEPLKGVHFAIEAINRLPHRASGRLVVVGQQTTRYVEWLRHRYDTSRVDFVGFSDRVPALMQDAHVLLLPTYTEGSALVTHEAMASALPPLVSRSGGAHVTHGVSALLHDVGDVDTLADQLRFLHEDRAALRELSENAAAASRDLTWEAAGSALLSCYRRAIEA